MNLENFFLIPDNMQIWPFFAMKNGEERRMKSDFYERVDERRRFLVLEE